LNFAIRQRALPVDFACVECIGDFAVGFMRGYNPVTMLVIAAGSS
jgi:hypothetical protein